MKIKAILGTFIIVATAFGSTAMAVEKGDILLRFGASNVSPQSDNHDVVSVDDDTSITFNLSYFMTNNLAVELLAAYPFEHAITLAGTNTKVGRTKHLPPTVTLQYHFMPNAKFKPYVGLGGNFTMFFNEKTVGPLAGTPLKLKNSFGLAFEAGADIMLNEKWLLNFSMRNIDIDTKAKLGGASIGTVDIDPWVYSLNLGLKF